LLRSMRIGSAGGAGGGVVLGGRLVCRAMVAPLWSFRAGLRRRSRQWCSPRRRRADSAGSYSRSPFPCYCTARLSAAGNSFVF
jgi:hypothetical protein